LRKLEKREKGKKKKKGGETFKKQNTSCLGGGEGGKERICTQKIRENPEEGGRKVKKLVRIWKLRGERGGGDFCVEIVRKLNGRKKEEKKWNPPHNTEGIIPRVKTGVKQKKEKRREI